MIKRIIEVQNQSYLHLKNKQLIIEQHHEQVAQIPIEDIGVLILEHCAISLTQPLIIACQKQNVAIVFCDQKHLPYATILPLSEGHTLHQKVLQLQIHITEPVRKGIWKQIVQQKIKNQAIVLRSYGKSAERLDKLTQEVKSGDTTNIEGIAAQYYWKSLFGSSFVRDQEATGINALLNYGYSIVRAGVARSIVGSGLHPSIGVFHHNQYNGLCLADDIMEPFRPWVDAMVYDRVIHDKTIEITTPVKTPFLKLMSEPVTYQGKHMPMMVSLHYLMADLKRVMQKEIKKLNFPVR